MTSLARWILRKGYTPNCAINSTVPPGRRFEGLLEVFQRTNPNQKAKASERARAVFPTPPSPYWRRNVLSRCHAILPLPCARHRVIYIGTNFPTNGFSCCARLFHLSFLSTRFCFCFLKDSFVTLVHDLRVRQSFEDREAVIVERLHPYAKICLWFVSADWTLDGIVSDGFVWECTALNVYIRLWRR